MRNRVKLLLVFSCVLWIACGLFCRTQTIDASSKIPSRYTFTKICDMEGYYQPYGLSMNNEGTVAIRFKDFFYVNNPDFIATGDGLVFTELIKNGDIVFPGWKAAGLGHPFIDDKGLIWFTMSTSTEDTNDYGVYTIDNSKRLSKIIDRRSAWFGMLSGGNNNETLLFLKNMEDSDLSYDTILTCRYGALTTIVDNKTLLIWDIHV